MTSITLPEDIMKDVVQAAILNMITDDQRKVLMDDAIKYLVTQPAKDTYQRTQPPSPVMEIWRMEMTKVAREVVAELVSDSEIKAAIEEQMRSTLQRILDERGMSSAIGWAVGEKVTEILAGQS